MPVITTAPPTARESACRQQLRPPDQGRDPPTLAARPHQTYVDDFASFAEAHPEITFQVTAIGCGLAGYKVAQIAPFFEKVPGNCVLPSEFLAELGRPGGELSR